MPVEVKRFGENGDDMWYELSNGFRVKCGEAEIEKLWFDWVASENAVRADTEHYTIFEFIEPVEIDI